jgi:putative membrane protein
VNDDELRHDARQLVDRLGRGIDEAFGFLPRLFAHDLFHAPPLLELAGHRHAEERDAPARVLGAARGEADGDAAFGRLVDDNEEFAGPWAHASAMVAFQLHRRQAGSKRPAPALMITFRRLVLGEPRLTIRNFSDHAANERTFLAWVRTSIAVTAFGFLVERFDLFLAIMAPASAAGKLAIHRSTFGHVAGLILIAAGVAITVLATLRFIRTAREIDEARLVPGTGSRIDIALAALLALLGVALFFYLSHIFSAG